MDNIERAINLLNNGCNCCQATLLPLCNDLGLDAETALKISCGFGGGMTQGEVCGTVSGAIMLLGLKNGNGSIEDQEAKEKTRELVKEFCGKFRQKNGSIICRELLGCDTSTESGKKYAEDNNLKKKICEGLLKDAIELVNKL